MAITRETYSHKVYFRSLEEYEKVRIRAKMSGAGSVSNYIRDLVVSDIRDAARATPLEQFMPESKAQPQVQNVIFDTKEEERGSLLDELFGGENDEEKSNEEKD